MSQFTKSSIVGLLMVVAAGLALLIHPTKRFSEMTMAMELEAIVPVAFNGWQAQPDTSIQVIDPQQAETIEQIYNQTLSRTYANAEGYRIMISLAYGEDQRDSVQLHYPEVCYPAQGFTLKNKVDALLPTSNGNINVTRLQTNLGQRYEPITYWTTVGNKVVRGRVNKKMTEMKYGLQGIIPDGLLFRVSSIDGDTQQAFDMQAQFVDALLAAVSPQERLRLSGLDHH